MAFLIKVDGHISPVKPKNGKTFSFEELYELIECELVQLIKLPDGYYMVIDESGAVKKNRVKNEIATEMYQTTLPPMEQRRELADKYVKELEAQGITVHTLPGNDEMYIYGNVVICKRNQID